MNRRIVLYLAIPATALLVALASLPPPTNYPETGWFPSLGHLHPVALHLPIGFVAALLLMAGLGAINAELRHRPTALLLLQLSFWSAALSAAFGIFLSWDGGYQERALAIHKWGAVATTGFLLFAMLLRLKGPSKQGAYSAVLALTALAITITGHQGGSLTHGSNFLTERLPFGSQEKVKSLAEASETNPFYLARVQPIFEDYCVSCHGEIKIKGGLRLDSFSALLAGGDSGPAMTANAPNESHLVEVMELPLGHDDHMPPEGKPQPRDEHITLIRQWIAQGASGQATLAQLEFSPEVQALFNEVPPLELRPLEEMEESLAALSDNPRLRIAPIAGDDARLRVRAPQASDADLEALLPLRSNIAFLDLSGAPITTAALLTIGEMTNLEELHLNRTSLDDRNAAALSRLSKLRYLNLTGTQMGDATLAALEHLPKLRNVFVWQTLVTPEGAKDLALTLYRDVEAERLKQEVGALEKSIEELKVEVVTGLEMEQAWSASRETAEAVKPTISRIMKTFHKGEDSMAKKVIRGELDDSDMNTLLDQYRTLQGMEPPEGDSASWNQRTSELVDSLQAVIAGEPGATKRYEQAVNCKACHDVHR